LNEIVLFEISKFFFLHVTIRSPYVARTWCVFVK